MDLGSPAGVATRNDMATDLVCGMTVDETTALRAERDGQTFYFCSEHCRRKFLGESSGPPAPKATPKDKPAVAMNVRVRRHSMAGTFTTTTMNISMAE